MIDDIDSTPHPAKIMVTGGRTYRDGKTVALVLSRYDEDPKPTLIHGNAAGLDSTAADIARKLGWTIEAHDADWQRYGAKRAGHIRNHEMINRRPDLCLVFPGGPGTAACRKAAQQNGIPTALVVPDDHAPHGFTVTLLSPPEDALIPLAEFPED